ncbi:MAG TPA: hypothetical protein VGN28_09395, partial [Blastococcus sp.]|nr:hypothetical protein [Blastococcus sp.]
MSGRAACGTKSIRNPEEARAERIDGSGETADPVTGWDARGLGRPREFTPADIDLMQVLAELCGGAQARARLADEQRQIADTLRRGLLP